MDSISKSMLSNSTVTQSNTMTTPSKQSPRHASTTTQPSNHYQIIRSNNDDTTLQTQWQHTILCYIFHVELTSNQSTTVKSNTPPSIRQRTVLHDLSKEVEMITVDMLDSLIVERLALPFNNVIATDSKSIVLSYLMQCFRRATDIYDNVHALKSTTNKSYYPATDDEKPPCIDCINTVWTTIGNYSAMCMTDSGMGTDPEGCINELYRLLSIDSEYNTRTGLPTYYLAALCKTDDATTVFKTIIEKLKQNIIQIQYNADYDKQFEMIQSIILVIINLTQHKLIANLLSDTNNFIPYATTGRQFQVQQLLGPLMSCATPPNLPVFQNAMSRPGPEVLDTINSQRSTYNQYQRQLCRIYDQLIKADKHSRERTLSLISVILKLNASAAKMHYNQQLVATTSYMYNISVIMMHLVTPIVDEEKYLAKVKVRSKDAVKEATIAQFNKIALNYYLSGTKNRISYDGVTRIGATMNDINLYRESHDTNTTYNFITECFAMTHECIHVGFLPITRTYLKYQEQLQQVMDELRNYQQNSPQYTMIEAQRNQMAASVLSLRVHLDDMSILEPLLQFYNFTSSYVAHTVHTSKPLALILPEYLVEDTIEFYTFIARFQEKLFKELYLSGSSKLDGLFDMMLTLGYGEDKLTNFHLRGKFAELLFLMLPRSNDGSEDTLSESHVFYQNPKLQAGLIPLLIDLFIEVEFGTNQFYAKFTSRYYIAELIKHLYTIKCHKEKLIATLSDIEYAVKLLNALANDVIYLLDDALKNLSEIHELELEQDAGQWNTLTPDELKAKQKKLKDAERGAKSTMNLGNAIVHMLHYLTIDIVEPFVSDVMVERIATIITYYIDKLIGNTVQDLKVKDKAKYSFQPRVLLSEIIQIFINLSVSEQFLEKVASDERSYSAEIWNKAARTLRKRQILPESTIQKFEQLSVRVAEINENISNLDEILGDVPDEYCDTLIGTIMTTPVLLPSSKQLVDKATIQRHLMNTPADPFNRAPLTVDQLIPQPELEAEIKQWVEQRKKEYKEEKRKELLAIHEAETAEKASKAAKESEQDDAANTSTADTDMINGNTT